MKYKLITIDMDGTLLGDNKITSYNNIKAIREAMDKGIKIVLASSRTLGTLKWHYDEICRLQPLVCCNGAIILDEYGEVIRNEVLEAEKILKIIEIARKMGDIYYHFYDGDIMISEKFKYGVERFYKFNLSVERDYRIEIRIVGDAMLYIKNNPFNINKLVLMDNDPNTIINIMKEIKSIEGIECSQSEWNNMEIVKLGIDKGTSLKFLAKYYGYSLDECIAIGNGENDISMVRTAGLGIAVKNASKDLKKIANYVTSRDNNNDAVAEVIEKFIV